MFRLSLSLFSLVMLIPITIYSSSISPLLETLVKKDVITVQEASDIQRDMLLKQKGLDEKIQFSGELTTQFKHHNRSIPNDAGRDIGALLTAKAGADIQVNPDTLIKFGLSTGDGNSRTRYQRADQFHSYGLQLDYAYGEMQYLPNFVIKAGKMTTPYWTVSDLIWDPDITHDGIWMDVQINPRHDLRFGYFFLGQYEQHGVEGPRLLSGQYLYQTPTESGGAFKLGFSGYFFGQVEGLELTDGQTASGLNNAVTTANVNGVTHSYLAESFSVFQTALSYDLNPDSLDRFNLRYVSLFADFVINLGVSSSNRGLLLGVKFGDSTVTESGEWRGTIDYRFLQNNAMLDVFPTNEAYGGNTGIKGIHFGYLAGIRHGLVFFADGYFMEGEEISTIDTVVTGGFRAFF